MKPPIQVSRQNISISSNGETSNVLKWDSGSSWDTVGLFWDMVSGLTRNPVIKAFIAIISVGTIVPR